VTATQITISWIAPKNDGGCSLIGYAIYVDNSDGSFDEYDSTNVRNKPLLHTYTIDMTALTPPRASGQTYLIRMGAVNSIGEVYSDSVSVLLASVPTAPSPPLKQVLNSTHARIAMSPPSSDGGDTITSYQLQLKTTTGQETWNTVLGETGVLNLDLTYDVPISSLGALIQARFRCQNEIGWSDYSSTNSLLMARVPSSPPKPIYASSTSTSITIQITHSNDTGGSTILWHEVWYETGGVLTNDTSYDGVATSHAISSLTAGTIYRIATRSSNVVGYSEWSEYLELAASALPAAPASIRKVSTSSSKTEIQLEWDKVANQDVPTTGYLLWMALNTQGSEGFVLIMNGT
jgi:hypothetical protein